jgi:hypothetical protein
MLQLPLFFHPLTKSFELPPRQLEGNRLAVFLAVDRGKAHAQLVGQLLLAEPQLLADFFNRLRKIFRRLCHIGCLNFWCATNSPAASKRNLPNVQLRPSI